MALLGSCTLFILLVLQHGLPTALAEKLPEQTCSCCPGVPGTPGHNGLPGRDGRDGAAGQRGEKGDTGMMGPQGPYGKFGPPGAAGPEGPSGPEGEKGERGPAGPLPAVNLVELQKELQTLKELLNKITQFQFTKRVGRKYFASDKKLGKFDEAVELCSSVGGVPALPASLEENAALSGLLTGSEHAWLSVNDRKTEAKFTDLQGKAHLFRGWKDGEPNDYGGKEDCAITSSAGKWNDVNCDSTYLIVCEI